MIELYKNKNVECFICGIQLNGEQIKKIGNNYYCEDDYSREVETQETKQMIKEDNIQKKILNGMKV